MRTVAIIGAGFCGTLVAAHLLRRELPCGLRVVLINRSTTGQPGMDASAAAATSGMARGLAYGTQSTEHLLNVPAGRMSAFAERPDDFFNFLASQNVPATRSSFVARSLYGTYLGRTLRDAEKFGSRIGNTLEKKFVDITALDTTSMNSFRLSANNGNAISADAVVLALGNFAPASPVLGDDAWQSSRRYVRDPWARDALRDVATDQPILLIGSGLTMYDVAISLSTLHQHSGDPTRLRLTALSRRGLLPQAHRDNQFAPHLVDPPAGLNDCRTSVRLMLRCIRAHVKTQAARGVDWRDVIASLRSQTPALWAGLSAIERLRFLQHLRPYWDSHRHRAAPQIADKIGDLIDAGKIALIAARILGVEAHNHGFTVAIRERGTCHAKSCNFGAIINCTGPSDDVRAEPLLSDLLMSGKIRPDTSRLGLDVSSEYRLRDVDGEAQTNFFYVGPLLKAQFWEATAVPELREHAADAADKVFAELQRTLPRDRALPT